MKRTVSGTPVKDIADLKTDKLETSISDSSSDSEESYPDKSKDQPIHSDPRAKKAFIIESAFDSIRKIKKSRGMTLSLSGSYQKKLKKTTSNEETAYYLQNLLHQCLFEELVNEILESGIEEDGKETPTEFKVQVDDRNFNHLFFQLILFCANPPPQKMGLNTKEYQQKIISAIQSLITKKPYFLTNQASSVGYCANYPHQNESCHLAEIAAFYGNLALLKLFKQLNLLSENCSLLHRAAPQGGNINVFKFLVEDCKLDPNAPADPSLPLPYKEGSLKFPLSAAIFFKQKPAAQYLLDHKADTILPLLEAKMSTIETKAYVLFINDQFPSLHIEELIDERISQLPADHPGILLLQTAKGYLSKESEEEDEEEEESTQPLDNTQPLSPTSAEESGEAEADITTSAADEKSSPKSQIVASKIPISELLTQSRSPISSGRIKRKSSHPDKEHDQNAQQQLEF